MERPLYSFNTIENSVIAILMDSHFSDSPIEVPRIKKFREDVPSLLDKYKVTHVIQAGDFGHSHSHRTRNEITRELDIAEMLADKGRPTAILSGNHDCDSPTIFLTGESHLSNYNKFMDRTKYVDLLTPNEIIDKYPDYVEMTRDAHPYLQFVSKGTVYSVCGYRILLVPYVTEGRFREAANIIAPGWDDPVGSPRRVHFVIGHNLIRFCTIGGIQLTDEKYDAWRDTDPIAIFGHNHQRQSIGNNFHYIGIENICILTLNNTIGYGIRVIPVPGFIKSQYLNLEPNEFSSLENINVADNVKLLVRIKGSQNERDAIKSTRLYKDLKKIPNLKIKFLPSESTIDITVFNDGISILSMALNLNECDGITLEESMEIYSYSNDTD